MDASSQKDRIRQFFRPARRYIYAFALLTSVVRYGLLLWFFPQFDWMERLFFSTLSFVFIVVMWESVDAFNRYLNRVLPFETGVLRRFIVQAGTCLIVLTAMQTSLMRYFEHYYIDYFPPTLVNVIKIASYGLNVFVVVAVNTAYFGFYFFGKWKKNLVERETWQKEKALLQKEKLNTQYENLKNQLNPHFLFNSLSSLDGLIHENPALASDFLRQLSKVFRYVLQNKDRELVSLRTELEFIQNYVSLLKTRFNGSLDVRVQVPMEATEKSIVPVTLQILVENAIKHNIATVAQPLLIQISADENYLTVENNLQRKQNVDTSNRQGLTNLKALYQFLSTEEVRVEEDSNRFRVGVPLCSRN